MTDTGRGAWLDDDEADARLRLRHWLLALLLLFLTQKIAPLLIFFF